MKDLKIMLSIVIAILFWLALPSRAEQQREIEHNQEIRDIESYNAQVERENARQWNEDARRMQEERDSKTYEIYLHRDIITLMYSPDYDTWIMHSEIHGELTDRTDDMHGLLKAIGELSILEQAREESEDYDNYINIINQHI